MRYYDAIEIIDMFLADHDVSAATKSQYYTLLKQLFRWLKNNAIEYYNISTADMVRFKAELFQKKKSDLTVCNYISCYRVFFKWMELNNLSKNVMGAIRLPRKYKGFRKLPLTLDQARNLLSSIDTATLKGKRDYLIISLMLRNGLREIEIQRMNVGDIKSDNDYKIEIQRKGKLYKNDYAILSDKTFDQLQDYLIERKRWNDDSPLFVSLSHNNFNKRINTKSISYIIKEKLQAIGLNDKRYTAHSLRHTAAVLALKNGATEYEVQTFMGHSSFATTQIYTRFIEQEQRQNNNPGKILSSLY